MTNITKLMTLQIFMLKIDTDSDYLSLTIEWPGEQVSNKIINYAH